VEHNKFDEKTELNLLMAAVPKITQVKKKTGLGSFFFLKFWRNFFLVFSAFSIPVSRFPLSRFPVFPVFGFLVVPFSRFPLYCFPTFPVARFLPLPFPFPLPPSPSLPFPFPSPPKLNSTSPNQAIMSLPLGTNKEFETMAGKIHYKMAKLTKNALKEERIAHLKEAVIR
jgi:hypothetical protein